MSSVLLIMILVRIVAMMLSLVLLLVSVIVWLLLRGTRLLNKMRLMTLWLLASLVLRHRSFLLHV